MEAASCPARIVVLQLGIAATTAEGLDFSAVAEDDRQ
jgi:hypothetical protein